MHDASITVLLNAYKRPDALVEQFSAVCNQSIPVARVLIWQNGSSFRIPKHIQENAIIAKCEPNVGVWARFSFALLAETEYVCIFDDDTIPGKRWLENCLATMAAQEGLLGTRGLRFKSRVSYLGAEVVGWSRPNQDIEVVDIVGHSWFFRRDWLQYFWKEPRVNRVDGLAGEDMHFSYALRKNLGLPTLVPPHPIDQPEMWGSIPHFAFNFGTSESAISMSREAHGRFQRAFVFYRDSGLTFNSLGGLSSDLRSALLLGRSRLSFRRTLGCLPGFNLLHRLYKSRLTQRRARRVGSTSQMDD